MNYRKFKADLVFDGFNYLPEDTVLITSPEGTIIELTSTGQAGPDVEHLNGLLCPGFINTHCHLELSHMKGIVPAGTGLVDFLTTVIRERNMDPDTIQAAIDNAEQDMYQQGITAVGDICNTSNTIKTKKRSRITFHNFVEVIGFTREIADTRMAYATRVRDEFEQESGADRPVAVSIVPHAPYSVSATLFGLINEASAGKPVCLHNQESAAERELYQSGSGDFFRLYNNLAIDPSQFVPSGKSSLQTCLPLLDKASTMLLVHNTYTEREDIIAAEPVNPFYCICINANRYIESRNPPLQLLREMNCRMTLGTDSLASNRQLNIVEEMKTIQREFPDIPLEEILRWATSNGAKALEQRLGSLDAGTTPGIVLIDKLDNGRLTAGSKSRRIC